MEYFWKIKLNNEKHQTTNIPKNKVIRAFTCRHQWAVGKCSVEARLLLVAKICSSNPASHPRILPGALTIKCVVRFITDVKDPITLFEGEYAIMS